MSCVSPVSRECTLVDGCTLCVRLLFVRLGVGRVTTSKHLIHHDSCKTYFALHKKGAYMLSSSQGRAKRHRKVLRDNIQGITKPAIRRLARRGG
eukprot:3370251-Prymnesium_polylepis.2